MFDIEPFSIVGSKVEPLPSNQTTESQAPSKVEKTNSPQEKTTPNRTALYVGIATLINGVILGVLLS